MASSFQDISRSFCFFAALAFFAAGCASSGPSLQKINQEQGATIQSLNKEIQRLNAELNAFAAREGASSAAPVSSGSDMQEMKSDLEEKLSGSMEAGDLTISMEDKGLVVTVLDRILFDPGTTELKPSALATLDELARVLQEEARDNIIYIEGHTDDVPIRKSAWRSNWELSTARATEVVHYFADQKGIRPERLAATGYGEFRPVVLNDSPEGRMKNRRVEIVISPKTTGN